MAAVPPETHRTSLGAPLPGATGPLSMPVTSPWSRLVALVAEPWNPHPEPQRRRFQRNQAVISLLLLAWCVFGLLAIPVLFGRGMGPIEILPAAAALFLTAHFLSRLAMHDEAGLILIVTQLLVPVADVVHRQALDAHDVAMSLTWGVSGLLLVGFVLPAWWHAVFLGGYFGLMLWLPSLVPGMEPQGPLMAAPLIGGMGLIIHAMATYWQRDLREGDARNDVLRRQRGELREAHAEVLRLNRQKDELLSVVSHELRTPLTAIKAAVRLMPEAEVDTPEELYLRMIRQNTDRLAAIIEDLLDISRLDLGEMQYRPDEGDLAELVQLMGASMASVYQEAGLELVIDAQPARAVFDEGRLAQVLQNLLSNAAKFTPRGGRVTVRVRPDGAGARIEVQDTGMGIPAQHLEDVFGKFFQVDTSDTRSQGGTGLGLAICRAIVEHGHGGRIWAERPGEGGARFVITLPARRLSS